MAIERFAKLGILAHRSDREGLIAELQRLGVVEVSEPTALPAAAEAPEEGELAALLRRVEEVARRLAPHRPPPGLRERLLPRPRRCTEEELSRLAGSFGLTGWLGRLDELRGREEAARAGTARLEQEARQLEPWAAFDVPLAALQPTPAVFAATGFVPARGLARLERLVDEAGGVCHRAGTAGRAVAVAVFAHRSAEEAVRAAFAAVRWAAAPLPALGVTAAARLAAIAGEREDLAGDLRAVGAALAAEATSLEDLLAVRDHVALRHERAQARRRLGESRETVLIEGWAPRRLVEPTRRALERAFPLVALEAAEPGPADRVPVALRNRPLVRPFQAVVELYGLPRYGGIDPTATLGPFFALFFGFCVADAGYGLVLALAAGAGVLLTPRELVARRRFLGLFALGGCAAVLVGAAAGSWLGVAAPWRLFDPLRDLLGFFAAALLLGTAHVFAGLLLRMIHEFRRGRVLAPLLDQGLWIALVGALLALLGAKVGVLPAAAVAACAFAAVLAAAGIVCFHGRSEREEGREGRRHLLWGGLAVAGALFILGHGRPWSGLAAAAFLAAEVALERGRVGPALGRLGLGLYALYGVSGYLSDLLSYSRLVALGLGSGTVAMVVNTMAALALDLPVAGLLLAALIFVGGHLFNLAINLLGAFVHSCRLQYVEFFTKFYGSGGRAFAPFRLAPRHVTIVPGGPAAGAAGGG